MRFKDVPLNSMFTMSIGGGKALCQKITNTAIKVQKLNRPGYLAIQIHPELNEDECTLTHQTFPVEDVSK